MNIDNTTKLCNGRSVSTAFLNDLREVIMERIQLLPPTMIFTLEKICGDDLWDHLNSGERRRAGWAMKHWVDMGVFPLRVAETRHEYPIHYQLK